MKDVTTGERDGYDAEVAALREKKLRAILEADRRVEDRSRDWERAKAEAKAAKEAYNEALCDRNDVLHDARGGQLRLDEAPAARAPEAAADEAWKAVRLDAGGTGWQIKPRFVKALAEAGIETWGQFSAAVERDGDFWHKNVKGLGKSAADSISDAWEAFWAEQQAARERRQHEDGLERIDGEAAGLDNEGIERCFAGEALEAANGRSAPGVPLFGIGDRKFVLSRVSRDAAGEPMSGTAWLIVPVTQYDGTTSLKAEEELGSLIGQLVAPHGLLENWIIARECRVVWNAQPEAEAEPTDVGAEAADGGAGEAESPPTPEGEGGIADDAGYWRVQRIIRGRRADALDAVAECESADELRACLEQEPKGDWRRAAIHRRLAELDATKP